MKWIALVQAVGAVLAAISRLIKALKAAFVGSDELTDSGRVGSLFD